MPGPWYTGWRPDGRRRWTQHRIDEQDHSKWLRWIQTYRQWEDQHLGKGTQKLTLGNQWTILILKGGPDLETIIKEAGINLRGVPGAHPTPMEEGSRGSVTS